MNIKSKQSRIIGITALVALFSLGGSFVFSPVSQAASAQSPLDSVTSFCKSKVKKATSSCPKAAGQAVNKASYNCKKSSNKEKCIASKAKTYITAASKGNPNDAKFKTQLNAKLDKVKGSADTPYTAALSTTGDNSFFGGSNGKYQCGGDDSDPIATKIDFGCLGPDEAPEDMGPITDLAFAFIRFLSAGVGLVMVASIVYAGIQYSTSEGNAETTQAAKARIRNAIIGLVIYIFGFSLVQFLVPGGLFN